MLAVLLASFSAQAHLKFPAVRAERSIELRLAEEPIRIGYRVGFGAELAKKARKAADSDGDGTVSVVEGNRALDERSAALLENLEICTGRSLPTLECRHLGRREIERVEAEGWVPGAQEHLHFAWTLRLHTDAGAIGAIRLKDGWKVEGVEITDVRIDAPSHAELTRAGAGESPEHVATEFTWIDSRERDLRVVSATWPPPRSRSWIGVSVALALGGAGAFALWVARRRAQPDG